MEVLASDGSFIFLLASTASGSDDGEVQKGDLTR